MVAALKEVRLHQPREVIVAVPVAAPTSLEVVRIWADEIFCLHSPSDFWAVGAYYEDFRTVEDKEVVDILRDFQLKSSKPKSEESAVAGATVGRPN
jgi:predicted phosphoribosyltransferase